MGPVREDGRAAYPTLFANKWLKSSALKLSEKGVSNTQSADLVDISGPKRAEKHRFSTLSGPVSHTFGTFRTVSSRRSKKFATR